MFETLALGDLTPRAASLYLGLGLGLVFGALALASGFCFRRALVGPRGGRLRAAALWALALAVAVAGTQAAVAAGWIGFDGHRFATTELPWLAVVGGGVVFGAGMALARGCPARLTVLAAAGNLRAVVTLLVFAVVALAALRGVLTPPRLALSAVTVPVPGLLPGAVALWVLALAVLAAGLAWIARPGAGGLAMAAGIGALVPLGWVGTGWILVDDFDPIPAESLSFVGPWGEALFHSLVSTGTGGGFGTGLVGGTLAGALALAALTGRLRWEGFSGPRQMGRYMTGGAMMGLGGVAAGGCTISAGLGGLPTLGIAAALALAAIAAGALLMSALLSDARGSGAPDTTPPERPAA